MRTVRFSARALRDLSEIQAFVAADNPHAAAVLTTALLARVAILATFPEAGRVVPEWSDPSVRELIEGNYRIIYRVGAGQGPTTETLDVVTVAEGHRRLKR